MERKRYDILGVQVDAVGFEEAIQRVVDWAESRSPQYVCFTNVHMVIEAKSRKPFMEVVNNAGLVLADGKPIAKSFEWLYNIKQERIAGMDFLPAIIERAAKQNLKIFLVGSTCDMLTRISAKIKEAHGKELLAGTFSPPFRKLLPQEEVSINRTINESGANIVLVALGCPKQEEWMSRNYVSINAPLLGVGGAFSVFAGVQKRAPLWMQKAGLEWAYRLVQEPKRLVGRYATTNSQFVYHLLVALSGKARV